jgi:hypothetical protein
VKKTLTIVPDLLSNNASDNSPIHAAGPQMWEVKRVHSAVKFSALTGHPNGLNEHYAEHRGTFVRGVERRGEQVPKEYEAKARKTDRNLGTPGNHAVLQSLRRLPVVKPLVVGAFGELGHVFQLLISGLAHEGALKKPEAFGQTKPHVARGIITWWLQKRWSRKALISAAESRYDALRYVGGSAQEQAAREHLRQEQGEDCFDADARHFREREAHFHHI